MKIKYTCGNVVMSGHRIDICALPSSTMLGLSVAQHHRDASSVRIVLDNDMAMRAGGTGKWYPRRRDHPE